MALALQYITLAGLGLVCGYIAHRLVVSTRGSLRRRLFLNRLLDGLAALPGLALIGILAPKKLPDANHVVGYWRLAAAFFIPFLLARVGTDFSLKRAAKRREGTLAFEVWYELLEKTPAKAHQFIEGYLAQEAQLTSVSARVLELQGACNFLERAHAGDRSLPGALAVLRGHIARLEQERVRSLGSSPS